MSERKPTIGVVGTFDVENYGDLLFPLIAREELAARLGEVELVCFSYNAKSGDGWPFPVTALSELPRLAPRLDAMLIGGGFLVRFDKDVAPGYGPATAGIHHPTGYWLTPALIALQHGVPLLWNTPGMDYSDVPEWAHPLAALAFSLSSYVAVRDEPSRAALARFLGRNRIEVVPDTVFGLARRLPDPPSFEVNRLRDAHGIAGPYIVVQPVRGLDDCCRFLAEQADRLRGYRFLVLPLGPVNGDDATRLTAALPNGVRLPVWPEPYRLAELIRGADGVIGPSFHLAITALGAGVPIFSPADLTQGKFPGLASFDGIHPLPAPERDAEWFVSRLGRREVSPKVDTAIERLDAHWNRIAEVIGQGRTDSAVAVGQFWQSLPGLLEGLAQRADGALAALADLQSRPAGAPAALDGAAVEAERAAAASRIAELKRVLAIARGEIASRDRRIAQFQSSTSWRLTSPLRFVGQRLKR